ncbi:alpha/beta fold hydrolase [Streptomyces sp. NPDC059455]|uniref:alpha/beta fold hydrolase n=1 Tax=Streptomyces sp. NPDC059455 TaxID=3346837 RepID=UPI00369635FC
MRAERAERAEQADGRADLAGSAAGVTRPASAPRGGAGRGRRRTRQRGRGRDPAIAREYPATFPNATLRTIEEAGHVIDADRPAACRDAVTAFLAAFLHAPATGSR